MSDSGLIRTCPECGHHTSAALGGKCTAFIRTDYDDAVVMYCGCNCYKAMTGKDLFSEIVKGLWG